MLATVYLLQEAEEQILVEGVIESVKNTFKKPNMVKLTQDVDVKNFIKLSEKIFRSRKASIQEKKELERLLKTKPVKIYLENVNESVSLQGKVMGGWTGGAVGVYGGLLSQIVTLGFSATVASAISAALIGGVSLGLIGMVLGKKIMQFFARRGQEASVKAAAYGQPSRGADVNILPGRA